MSFQFHAGLSKDTGKKTFAVVKSGADITDQAIELGWRDGDAQEVKSGLAEDAEWVSSSSPRRKNEGRRR